MHANRNYQSTKHSYACTFLHMYIFKACRLNPFCIMHAIRQICVKFTLACMPTESCQSTQHFHACTFSCMSESLFAHQIHLPCLCLVLMSYYHCTSRLGSREVQWSPYRSPAQARAAGHESASATLSLCRMEDQGLQLGGQGATVQLTCQPVSQRRRRRAG